MTTLCTECGERIESVRLVEGIKTILHLRKSHPNLYKMFRDGGSEQMTASVCLEEDEVLHFIRGNVIEYIEENGKTHIKIS
jgi:hypothetical protein